MRPTAALGPVDVPAEAESCGRDCFGGAMCVLRCVVREAGISDSCATCFSDVASCVTRNCFSACIGSDAAACDTCRATSGCNSAFEACTGIPGS